MATSLPQVSTREALASSTLKVLDEHTISADLPELLEPLEAGEDLGIMSEAGIPCVADPEPRPRRPCPRTGNQDRTSVRTFIAHACTFGIRT